jgi:quinohemoprotein ethanol dehydrogenase
MGITGLRAKVLASLLVSLAAVGCASDTGVTTATTAPANADWTGYGGPIGDAHYSPLDQINDQTIEKLGLEWSYDIDVQPGAHSAPVEAGGVLYFAAGFSIIQALDVKTGKLLWRYDPQSARASGERMRAIWGVRGIAYDNGKIFTGTVDGRLIALDAKTGKELWSAMTLEPNDGRYITGAPWVFNGKVVIGHGGADFAPVRGYVTAYDQATGKQVWRFYTVPGDPAKGFENAAMKMAATTWTGEWWKWGGGGTVWNAMAYDPRYNRIYIGTGNGAPWNQKIRSPGGGDNLFLCSIVALDADTGEYVWHYQVNPGETWDYNAAMDITLADLKIDGRERHVLLHAPKNGFFYVIDRETGKLISAKPFAKTITWAEGIDEKTGRPIEKPEARYPDGKPFLLMPSPLGAHSVEAWSFSPKSGLTYIPAIEVGRVLVDPPNLKEWKFIPGEVVTNNGIGVAPPDIKVPPITNRLLAWNPITQKAAWEIPLVGRKNGGLLSTAGNLVFQGDGAGFVSAYTADKGQKVWSFDGQNGILSQPISYMVDGRQYVSVITSFRGSGVGGPGLENDYRTQHRRVLTFALGGGAKLPADDRTIAPIADDPQFKVDAKRAAAGMEIFNVRCAICHGGGATAAGSAPDLRRSPIPLGFETFSTVVREGPFIENGMPAFTEMEPDDLLSVQHYIRQQARAALAPKQ